MALQQQVEQDFIDRPGRESLKALINFDHSEALIKLRQQVEVKDFRYTQGQLALLDRYQELLTKAAL